MGAGKKVLAESAGTVWVKPEDGGISMVSFSAGDEVPGWAAEQMGDHCFTDDGDTSADAGDYSAMKKAALEAEVAKRNTDRDADHQIVVGGTGKVADLVEALEADDEANAN